MLLEAKIVTEQDRASKIFFDSIDISKQFWPKKQ
jgi:hypothetical protein